MENVSQNNQVLTYQPGDLPELTQREWLVTNGIGGYASSSICGMNTRRYHGMLVAALDPPIDRHVFVSKIEDRVCIGDTLYELSTNQYPGNISPEGYRWFDKFDRDPLPQQSFNMNGSVLVKEIFMPHKHNAVVISYHNQSGRNMRLDLRPHYIYRSYHHLFHQQGEFNFHFESSENEQTIFAKHDAIPLYVKWTEGEFTEDRIWYHQLELPAEQKRGQDFQEATHSIGYLRSYLAPGARMYLMFSIEKEILDADPSVLMQEELARLEKLVPVPQPSSTFVRDLVMAGDQFLVHRQSTNSTTILAGYHWFTDWSRDTMIAMRGLTIATQKQHQSRDIIKTFLQYLDQGMLPNRFPDGDSLPEYNNVDGTLWLFVAVYEYVNAFGDWDFITEILPQLRDILEHHISGTRYHIHITQDGLVYAGDRDTQLTWMDARIDKLAVTPRWGCPVEVNALWYNALNIYVYLASKLGAETHPWQGMIEPFKKTFRRHFLNMEGYLNDVVVPNRYNDRSIRPNQIYAISLPFQLLDRIDGLRIFQMVQKHLYTPLGLRTLSPHDESFKSEYKGSLWERDHAYHQGTVWPFLLQEYFQTYVWLYGVSNDTRNEIERGLAPLIHHFYMDNCIHGVSEIFDGMVPVYGKGTVHQAWSVSAMLYLIFKYQLFDIETDTRVNDPTFKTNWVR